MSDIEREAPKIEEGEARRDNRSDAPALPRSRDRAGGHPQMPVPAAVGGEGR